MVDKHGKIHVARIPRNSIKDSQLIRANGKGETLEQMYARLPDPKPDFLFNAGFYTMVDGWTLAAMKVDGRIIREKSAVKYGYAICGRGSTIHLRTMGDKSFAEISDGYDWAIESAPLILPQLVRNGLEASIVNTSQPRTVLGYDEKGDTYHLLVTDGRPYGLTCQQLATEMRKYGTTTAIGLDGGGSSKVLYKGRAINDQPERRTIANAIAIWLHDSTGDVDSVDKLKVAWCAGHGPETPGKRTPDGSMREYHFNSIVAKYAAELLSGYEGVEMLMVHDDSRDVPLKERTDKANAWGADLYVSIHVNAFGGTWNDANGIETFVYQRGIEAEEVAKAVQSEMIKLTDRRDRGVKVDNLHVLRETNMTAILVECGFMTNREEAELLKSDAYRRICANAIVNGIVSHYKLVKKSEPPKAPPTLYRVQVGAFSMRSNADKLAAELQQKGYSTIIKEDK